MRFRHVAVFKFLAHQWKEERSSLKKGGEERNDQSNRRKLKPQLELGKIKSKILACFTSLLKHKDTGNSITETSGEKAECKNFYIFLTGF